MVCLGLSYFLHSFSLPDTFLFPSSIPACSANLSPCSNHTYIILPFLLSLSFSFSPLFSNFWHLAPTFSAPFLSLYFSPLSSSLSWVFFCITLAKFSLNTPCPKNYVTDCQGRVVVGLLVHWLRSQPSQQLSAGIPKRQRLLAKIGF